MADFDSSPDPRMTSASDPTPEVHSEASPMSEDHSLTPDSVFGPEATQDVEASRGKGGLTLPEAIAQARHNGVEKFASQDRPHVALTPEELLLQVETAHAKCGGLGDWPKVYTVGPNGAIINTAAPPGRQSEYNPVQVKFGGGGGASLAPPEPALPGAPAPAPVPPAAAPPAPVPPQPEPPPRRTPPASPGRHWRAAVSRYAGLQVDTDRTVDRVAVGCPVGHFRVNDSLGLARAATDPIGTAAPPPPEAG